MQGALLVFLILLIPAASAPVLLFLRQPAPRKIFIGVVSAAMILVAVILGVGMLQNGPLVLATENYHWVGPIVTVIDVAVLVSILYFGVRLKEWKVIVPSIIQAALVFYIEVIRRIGESEYLINIDYLGLIILLISSIIGPLIAVFAIGYMQKHEEHLKLKKTRQPLFFAVIFLFLFAMNFLAITDNLMHLYAFWEITTLCSFLLIAHDRNKISIVNAKRALWMNSVAGLFFAIGIVLIIESGGSFSISELVASGSAVGTVVTIGVLFICSAGLVKAAQMPFQSWLLGAMVAPTPVSALLHSSTMVKAGVYVVVRFSPIFAGQITGDLVAIVGGFTFLATAALAISQSNGKRVLAYSTISNLGLIIACAGLGNSEALSAAMLLIIFHAVSKGLLFLCMGTVEQGIGSRNIEDMFGIYSKMPYTTVIMVTAMVSMVLPPFGVLITKWLALEAAVRVPLALLFIVVGSALTIAFWAKWVGATLTVYKDERPKMERIPFSVKLSLGVLGVSVILLTAFIPAVNNALVVPAVTGLFGGVSSVVGKVGGIYVTAQGGAMTGGFGGVLLLLGLIVVAFTAFYVGTRFNKPKIVAPYSGGELANKDVEGGQFVGPMDSVEKVKIHNYYLENFFSEKKVVPVASIISILLILIMFGVS